MNAFISYETYALAHQLLREFNGVCILDDIEFHRIKMRAINQMPEDQQTMLKDIVPSKNPDDYSAEVREVAQSLLNQYNYEQQQKLERERKEQKKLLLSIQDDAL